MSRMPTYFISHGGGPWPWIEDMRKVFVNLEASFREMVASLPERPAAILMISGHWEADDYAVMGAANPPMVYDYHGFPKHTFEIVYPAPGDPALAERVRGLLEGAGLPSHVDKAQGFDHGTFVPAYIMYPDADVPVVQLAIRHGYDPEEHIRVGRALAPLRDEGVLIVGSGLSFHNLRIFFRGEKAAVPSKAFDDWLTETLDEAPAARTQKIIRWEEAPYARVCHQEEDHLVPLFTALGAAEGEPATRVYHDEGLFGGVTASSWRFG